MSRGRLYVVGIGPGLPDKMTLEAREVVEGADVVAASSLYGEFLREGGLLGEELDVGAGGVEGFVEGDPFLPVEGETVSGVSIPEAAEVAEDGGLGSFVSPLGEGSVFMDDGRLLLESSMGSQVSLVCEVVARVRAGQDVAMVSGGDPGTYGKSDLVFAVLEALDAGDVEVEVVEGVTAGLSVASRLGSPVSGDFATVSLSTKWRDWERIEERLRGAARAGFVILIYNCWRRFGEAAEVLREELEPGTPVGIVQDAGRGDSGRAPEGETKLVTTLGEVDGYLERVSGMGVTVLVGNSESRVWEAGGERYILTARGERDIENF